MGAPLAAIVFYRSHLLSDDMAPVTALAAALRARGLAVGAIFAGSLKTPETAAYVARTLAAWRPAVVLNATGFSARRLDASPLDAAGAPVLQLVLAGSSRGGVAGQRARPVAGRPGDAGGAAGTGRAAADRAPCRSRRSASGPGAAICPHPEHARPGRHRAGRRPRRRVGAAGRDAASGSAGSRSCSATIRRSAASAATRWAWTVSPA